MMNEKVDEQLTKDQDAYERVRVALSWLKQNNHFYQTFLKQCTITLLVNPEMLTLNYPEILEEAIGMAFPIDST